MTTIDPSASQMPSNDATQRLALIPSTPLLLGHTSGAAQDVLAETRDAVAELLHWLISDLQHDLAIVAAGPDTSIWSSDAPSSIPGLGAPDSQTTSAGLGEQLPLGLSLGRELVAKLTSSKSCRGAQDRQVTYHAVADRPAGNEMDALVSSLSGKSVLFVADGSTRLGPKPPGGAWEGAQGYENTWQQNLADGQWQKLVSPEWAAAEEAGHLDVSVLAVLARCAVQRAEGGAQDAVKQTNAVRILHTEHPYGVGYCVAQIG